MQGLTGTTTVDSWCSQHPADCAAIFGGAFAAAHSTGNNATRPVSIPANVFNEQADQDDEKDPSTPTGQRGSPMDVEPGTNKPCNINGRDYTGHALDRMQGRGVTPSSVEDAIENGTSTPGNQPDTTVHSGDGVTVVTGSNGQVITVITR